MTTDPFAPYVTPAEREQQATRERALENAFARDAAEIRSATTEALQRKYANLRDPHGGMALRIARELNERQNRDGAKTFSVGQLVRAYHGVGTRFYGATGTITQIRDFRMTVEFRYEVDGRTCKHTIDAEPRLCEALN